MTKSPSNTTVRCCIAGGGPAGMMLGFLLARAGVKVLVLEKHNDFLRDFRGDTIHPSTLELMDELGLLEDFLSRPHQELREMTGQIENDVIPLADFSHLPTKCKFLAFMPQWDFLNFLAEHGASYPTFDLIMGAEVTELIETDGKITGVRVKCADSSSTVSAELIVAADGRHSIVRSQSGLEVEELGAPMDILWFRVQRKSADPGQILGRSVRGKIMVMHNRGEYWQCGFVIPKGAFTTFKQRGLEALHRDIVSVAPFLHDRVAEIKDWNEIRLLTVAVDRLTKWYRPGLLFIGDAAHAMSPIGGVGINLAIQDAVAAANILCGSLLKGCVSTAELERVQKRRQLPTRITQAGQVFIQNRVIGKTLGNTRVSSAPFMLKLFRYFPVLRRISARMIGIGIRPEHVHTPDAFGVRGLVAAL